MTRIICLIGPSGSGATTLTRELSEEVNVIPTYTTRFPRYEGEVGHIFGVVSAIIGTKVFSITKYGSEYFMFADQIKWNATNMVVTDPRGAEQTKNFYADNKEVEVTTVFLQVDEPIRAERLQYLVTDKSVLKYVTNDYKTILQIWERIRPDREIYAVVETDKVINNNGNIATGVDRLRGCL